MKKRLTQVGSSLGIIIERPILDLLNISRDTVLEVTTDGKRLVIEPTEEHVAPPRPSTASDEADADFTNPAETIPYLNALENEFGMDNGRFQELHHLPYANINAHRAYCQRRGTAFRERGTNVQTARRLKLCLERLRSGDDWAQAIAATLERYPK